MDSTTLKGTVQGYFDRAFTELTEDEFNTPLANSAFGVKARLAPNSGTFVQFRRFGELPLDVGTANDSPKTYGETQEPAAPMALSDEVFQVSTVEIAGYIPFRPKLLMQDPVDIMKISKKRLLKWARRMIHTVCNDRFVVPLGVAVTNLSNTYVEAPKPFRTIFAGGVAGFTGMKDDAYLTLADVSRAASLLRNAGVPTINGRYACVIDSPGIEQIKLGDSKFAELIKRFEGMNNRVFGEGDMIDYGGVFFTLQSDPYRCQLPAEGGALRTRKSAGKVRVAHVFGANAWGYLDMGDAGGEQRRALAPSFKVQDITVTGNLITCAVRMPVQAMVMQRDYGVNLAYTSAFDEKPTDLPDEDA